MPSTHTNNLTLLKLYRPFLYSVQASNFVYRPINTRAKNVHYPTRLFTITHINKEIPVQWAQAAEKLTLVTFRAHFVDEYEKTIPRV